MRRLLLISIFLLYPALAPGDKPTAAPDPVLIEEIKDEASRPNSDPIGHALPLAGNWNAIEPRGFGPTYQKDKLLSGNHILPWFQMPLPNTPAKNPYLNYYESALKWYATLGLPISFENYNWESILYGSSYPFYSLPADQNPNVINLDGTIRKQADTLGPIEPWRQAGRLWGASPIFQQLQAWYPNPPLVVFLSNNEANVLPWTDDLSSKRFVDRYGANADENTEMYVSAKGRIDRYTAFLDGFRSALTPAWQAKAVFEGFGNFGPPHFARWYYWYQYANPIPFEQYIDPSPFSWGGGSPPYYLFDWNPSRDDQVWGPQGEGQNWVFMLKEALRINPNYWLELSTWDGGQAKRSQLSNIIPFTPERYGAMVQFGMWLLRPRLVRDFRDGGTYVQTDGIWADATLAAVNKIYTNPVLKQFWRQAQLVPNRAWLHPYQFGTWWYSTEDRWFFLDTTLDPPHPFNNYTQLPVISLALVVGQTPTRGWLVYAQAPQGAKAGVGITVPDYGQITVDVPVAGTFYLVREGQPGAQLVSK